MDGEEFFDRLYSHFHVPFPCHAVLLSGGDGFATEGAEDGTESLVLLTDDDLVERYLIDSPDPRAFPVSITEPPLLAKLLRRLPPSITHVTFDPRPGFHRRYPIGAIRDSLAAPLAKKRKAG